MYDCFYFMSRDNLVAYMYFISGDELVAALYDCLTLYIVYFIFCVGLHIFVVRLPNFISGVYNRKKQVFYNGSIIL